MLEQCTTTQATTRVEATASKETAVLSWQRLSVST